MGYGAGTDSIDSEPTVSGDDLLEDSDGHDAEESRYFEVPENMEWVHLLLFLKNFMNQPWPGDLVRASSSTAKKLQI